MNIRIILWTLCMAVSGFLLAGSSASITSITILGLIIGAATGPGSGSCSLTEPDADTPSAKFANAAYCADADAVYQL